MKATHYICNEDGSISVTVAGENGFIAIDTYDTYSEQYSVLLTPDEAIELADEISNKALEQKRLADDSKAKASETDH